MEDILILINHDDYEFVMRYLHRHVRTLYSNKLACLKDYCKNMKKNNALKAFCDFEQL